MGKDKISVFVSHSDKEKEIAARLKSGLASFDVFLAHQDIAGGSDWTKALYEKMQQCDVVLVLLSKEYHAAWFTDQEAGMAYAMSKPILPISIDGTKPYGFMAKYQSAKCSDAFPANEIDKVANLILGLVEQGDVRIDALVEEFVNVESFREANALAHQIYQYQRFTKDQINSIAQAFLYNDQIQGAWDALPIVTGLLMQHWNVLEPKAQNDLLDVIGVRR